MITTKIVRKIAQKWASFLAKIYTYPTLFPIAIQHKEGHFKSNV